MTMRCALCGMANAFAIAGGTVFEPGVGTIAEFLKHYGIVPNIVDCGPENWLCTGCAKCIGSCQKAYRQFFQAVDSLKNRNVHRDVVVNESKHVAFLVSLKILLGSLHHHVPVNMNILVPITSRVLMFKPDNVVEFVQNGSVAHAELVQHNFLHSSQHADI
ncbi:unnamed protein product [Notodromas monacha]|uniref:Uncharacterized protein n=1 Tax=Notodromas monacha TaxID=399045 RepID=A0A7R9BF07_9CRUS|nr:unnamed protein product [Notodromas monacha]CAG0914155.1 unnamed protein product [Notodromas monacha]